MANKEEKRMGNVQPLANTERVLAHWAQAQAEGLKEMNFSVGKCTGNHPSVVRALRARGHRVDRVPPAVGSYKLVAS